MQSLTDRVGYLRKDDVHEVEYMSDMPIWRIKVDERAINDS